MQLRRAEAVDTEGGVRRGHRGVRSARTRGPTRSRVHRPSGVGGDGAGGTERCSFICDTATIGSGTVVTVLLTVLLAALLAAALTSAVVLADARTS